MITPVVARVLVRHIRSRAAGVVDHEVRDALPDGVPVRPVRAHVQAVARRL